MYRLLILQTAALLTGFILDFFVGDPHCIPHPVTAIGRLISFLDRHLRRGDDGDTGRGAFTVFLVASVSTLLPAGILAAAWRIHPALYFGIDSVMCWQILAARQLVRESRRVQRALEKEDILGARYAVSMIVGRDTDALDRDGICKAAVETVAENASDGVIAPLFWMTFLGAAGGFFYKSVNTMDSMIGYRNETYLRFGRAAAKTDDFVNFLPARLSALLMVCACPLCALDGAGAFRIFLRDRHKHESPNSAQTESACAGALGVQLAGGAVYGGVFRPRQTIGDARRKIEPADITRAGRLMYAASTLMLLIALLLRIVVILCC